MAVVLSALVVEKNAARAIPGRYPSAFAVQRTQARRPGLSVLESC
jgi:hypothetical protein